MGAQFAAVGKVYDAAKAKGAGREVPLGWFTQDVHPQPRLLFRAVSRSVVTQRYIES